MKITATQQKFIEIFALKAVPDAPALTFSMKRRSLAEWQQSKRGLVPAFD